MGYVAALGGLALGALVASFWQRFRGRKNLADQWLGLAFLFWLPVLGVKAYQGLVLPRMQSDADRNARALNLLEAERIAATPEGVAKSVYQKSGDVVPTVVRRGDTLAVTATTSNFLTAGILRYEALSQAADYFRKTFAANAAVNFIDIDHRAMLVDVRGQTKLDSVLKVTMSRETANTLNWANFDRNNFELVAERYWEHPAFSR